MSAKPPYEHNGEFYPGYCHPSDNVLLTGLSELRFMLEKFCDRTKLDYTKFSVDETLIIETLRRVDQRKLHYKMYHKGMDINELKEAALLCYWLTRYKPLVYDNGKCYTVGQYNEVFSLYLVLCVINAQKINNKLKPASFSKALIRDMVYTLSHRITTYDSMTLLVESLAR